MKPRPILLFYLTALFSFPQLISQSVSLPELIRVSYRSHGEKVQRDFYLYLPYGFHSSSPDRKWPVLMFLHGNGERGNGREDLDWVMAHGPIYEAWIQKRDLPFIIIAPQLPMYGMDSIPYIRDRKPEQIPRRLEAGVPDRPEEFATPQRMEPQAAAAWLPDALPPSGWEQEEDDLMEMIENVIKNYNGDESRIYLTGLSYGGFGTWYMASKHPKTWAAICPIVGWGHPDLMKPIAEHQVL